MVKDELLQRSPVRTFEKAIDGGLRAGEIGIICSQPGLGKTSVLVQIALDKLLQGKKVIHVSFTQHTDYVLVWYEDIFKEFIGKKNVENEKDIKEQLVRNRILLNFNQDSVDSDVIRKSLKAMIIDGGYKAEVIIIDGFDFSIVKRERIDTLKQFAKELGLIVWYSCSVPNNSYDKNNIPNTLKACEDCIDVLMVLESKGEFLGLSIVKKRGSYDSQMTLRLDTKTLLMLP